MLYKVTIDLGDAMVELKKMGVKAILKGPYSIKVEANDPDGACSAARAKVCNTAEKKWSKKFPEATKVIGNKMKIVKLEAA